MGGKDFGNLIRDVVIRVALQKTAYVAKDGCVAEADSAFRNTNGAIFTKIVWMVWTKLIAVSVTRNVKDAKMRGAFAYHFRGCAEWNRPKKSILFN